MSDKNINLFIIRNKITIACFLNFITAVTFGQNKAYTAVSQKPYVEDSARKLRVCEIVIEGNRQTKSYIILRELHLNPGDSISIEKMHEILEKARDQVYNTTLFIDVKVTPQIISAYDLDILVTVKERWYIFPIPAFQLSDRSFNEWLVKYNGDFNRVNYGIRFYHFNISGRNDRLSLALINGFTRNISFEYKAPYTNPLLSDGVIFGAGFSQIREIPFKTDSINNLVYYKNDDFVKNEWYITGSYSSRKAIKKKETFSITFRHIKVEDSVLSQHYNPNYFNSNSSYQNFIELGYKLQFTEVDNILYPLKGYATSLLFQKRGLQWEGGINQFIIRTSYNKYLAFSNQWYASIRFTAQADLPLGQAYINQRALGYKEDYLRGDEYFVIDGVAFGLAKFDLKKKLFHFNLPTFLNSKTYNKLPLTIYAKTFFDAGYVYCQPQFNTMLNKRFLYSGGFGIDILTLYDFKLSFEYSLNQLGQKDLFLHN